MASNKKFLNTLRNSGKEMVRNFLITLKKNPNMIPFAMLIISFLVYSLNLTYISNTTATIQNQDTGLDMEMYQETRGHTLVKLTFMVCTKVTTMIRCTQKFKLKPVPERQAIHLGYIVTTVITTW